jgi:hypothetical protein
MFHDRIRRRALVIILATLFACGCGKTGNTGPEGETGPAGQVGANGSKGVGERGAPGPRGTAGTDGSLRIYGDGSAGDLKVTTGKTVILSDPNQQFNDCDIETGAQLTVSSGTILRCAGTFTNAGFVVVIPGAKGGFNNITAYNDQRAPVLQSADAGASRVAAGGGLLAYNFDEQSPGGYGGVGLTEPQARTVLRPGVRGGGGGAGQGNNYGADGGGTITILALGGITNGGTIDADGSGLAGGGAGGGIVILASPASIASTGTITAVGGPGQASDATTAAGGGGGGGIVHFISPSITATGIVKVDGGAAGINTTPVTLVVHTGGGGGGACGGNGGVGAAVNPDGSGIGSQPGTAGYSLETTADPTALM